MPRQSLSRLQFVISGKFITLLLLSGSLLGGGYYWYDQQQQQQLKVVQTQSRLTPPPYFVNRGAVVTRVCQHCLEGGRLNPQNTWKLWPPQEISATEQRWFMAVEDPPLPVTVAGVLMLPVHPSFQDDPTFGFDQSRVLLVLYQSLERRQGVEKPKPPEPASPPVAETTAVTADRASTTDAAELATATIPPASPWLSVIGEWKNLNPGTLSVTRFLVAAKDDKLEFHCWAKCVSADCDWGTKETVLPADSKDIALIWEQGEVVYSQKISLEPDGKLQIIQQSHHADQTLHVNTQTVSLFTRISAPP